MQFFDEASTKAVTTAAAPAASTKAVIPAAAAPAAPAVTKVSPEQ